MLGHPGLQPARAQLDPARHPLPRPAPGWTSIGRRTPCQSTEFTYTRFLVPYLCGYQGKAIFIDCDMLCLGDIAELDRGWT